MPTEMRQTLDIKYSQDKIKASNVFCDFHAVQGMHLFINNIGQVKRNLYNEHISQVMRKCVMSYANNKGTDQPVHPRS